MIKHIIARARDERGFTLIELVMYVLILSIILGTATYFFVSMRDVNVLTNAGAEVETVMKRGYNLALNENQTVTLTFYGPGSAHPNTYSIVKEDGTSEGPALGDSFIADGGVNYIELQDGKEGLRVAATVVIVYDSQGTLFSVTSTGPVTISYSSWSRVISINSNGEVTITY